MKKLILIILLFTSISSANSEENKGGDGFLAEQMAEWCVGDTEKQNFCHGFLLGVYENSSCLTSRTMPDWKELKKVFIGWIYSKGSKSYVFASVSAATAFYEKYGCESYLLKFVSVHDKTLQSRRAD